MKAILWDHHRLGLGRPERLPSNIIILSPTVTMSLDPNAPSPGEGADDENSPTPISRLIQLRYTVSQPVLAAFLAGGMAGAVSRTVVSPLERLKILFQIQSAGRNEYKMSVGKGLMKMWRDEGWRGFMRGNGTNCIRIVPYSAVQFGSYNFYKRVSTESERLVVDWSGPDWNWYNINTQS